MKKLLLFNLFLLFVTLSAQKSENNGVLGDYNGDGKKEYAYSIVADCSDDCSGKCITTVYFSDENLKPFTIKNAKNGDLYNLKDLNDDGKDELGFYPNWCSSCWQSFYVYTFKQNDFKYLVDPISTHCSQWEDNKFPIEKDKSKKGYLKITSSVYKNNDIKTVSKLVKIKN